MVLRPNDLHRAKHDAISISTPSKNQLARCGPLRRFAASVDTLRPRLRAGLPTVARVSGRRLVGLSRFELLTPRLSSVCSNQLSYRPRYSQRTRLRPVGFAGLPAEARKREGRFSQNWIVRARTTLRARSIIECLLTRETLGSSLALMRSKITLERR